MFSGDLNRFESKPRSFARNLKYDNRIGCGKQYRALRLSHNTAKDFTHEEIRMFSAERSGPGSLDRIEACMSEDRALLFIPQLEIVVCYGFAEFSKQLCRYSERGHEN